MALLTAASDRLMSAFLDDPEQVYLQLRQGLVQEPDLNSLVAHAKTVPLVVQLLSPNIHLHSTSIIYKKPRDEALKARPSAAGTATSASPRISAIRACRASASRCVIA